jgi:C4-dicarboxylate-specific signal transduction histidine kinase
MREQESAFLGKISAGMTHEIKNVLAIIRESAGLMEDLLSLCRESSFPYQEKFGKVLGTIQEQVRRGVELTTRLNRFAHSMDAPVAEIEVGAFLEQMAFLTQRFARLKRLELEVLPAEQPITIRTDPFRLQLILAACLDHLFGLVKEGGRIGLRPRLEGANVAIHIFGVKEGFTGPSPEGELPEELGSLAEIIRALKAELHTLDAGGDAGFVLRLPMELATETHCN